MDVIRVLADHWVGAGLGALILVLAAHRLALSRDGIARQREAGKRIAEAFNPQLDALLQNKATGANKLLTDEILRKHRTVLNTELKNLSPWHRFRVGRAWKKLAYYKGYGPTYSHYFDAGSVNDRHRLVRFAIERLEALISVATK